ncbi:hypothetical protein KP509_35G025800 [Ceratopteris richardii]|uniref:Methyltransferase-like protein 13 n=1 Tax=Ceratopteris richardii TaxID=49495 RepID=A0A8T2QFD0_CERRI|nr:hypothetical protein KP509_35G025800 [Ceratopteris richardii]
MEELEANIRSWDSQASKWKDIEPGRCENLQISSPVHGGMSVSVLDAPVHLRTKSHFAVILVPQGRESDWIFCTSNGLWDLLFSAAVSRLVVFRRDPFLPISPHCEAYLQSSEKFGNDQSTKDLLKSSAKLGSSSGDEFVVQLSAASADGACGNGGGAAMNHGEFDYEAECDASIKEFLDPVIASLFPWSRYPLGPSPDPYVTYEDGVKDRIVLELGMRQLRRRMMFQQMPNLIQTEVPILIYKNGCLDSTLGIQDIKLEQQASKYWLSKDNSMVMQKDGRQEPSIHIEVRPDQSTIVHKYLLPIVAGFVLACPCLEACKKANTRGTVLTIGLGGGALPIFLHKQFGFSVLAVDTDEVVVELARRYFGFVENEHLNVKVMDGIEFIYGLAYKACRFNTIDAYILEEWQNNNGDIDQRILISDSFEHDRFHVVVVDVNVSDASMGLLSPPSCFLTKEFLLAVQRVLHEGGMLVINVVPRADHYLHLVFESLRKVFLGIYRIQVDGNHVLFAFLSKVHDIDMSGPFAQQVAFAVGECWFDCIEEVS